MSQSKASKPSTSHPIRPSIFTPAAGFAQLFSAKENVALSVLLHLVALNGF
jgi:hypothetical protein